MHEKEKEMLDQESIEKVREQLEAGECFTSKQSRQIAETMLIMADTMEKWELLLDTIASVQSAWNRIIWEYTGEYNTIDTEELAAPVSRITEQYADIAESTQKHYAVHIASDEVLCDDTA